VKRHVQHPLYQTWKSILRTGLVSRDCMAYRRGVRRCIDRRIASSLQASGLV
jgi:hypothetical protein